MFHVESSIGFVDAFSIPCHLDKWYRSPLYSVKCHNCTFEAAGQRFCDTYSNLSNKLVEVGFCRQPWCMIKSREMFKRNVVVNVSVREQNLLKAIWKNWQLLIFSFSTIFDILVMTWETWSWWLVIHPRIDTRSSNACLTWKQVKGVRNGHPTLDNMSWTSMNGTSDTWPRQYALDKYDYDILPHSIGWRLYYLTLHELSDVGWGWLLVSRCTSSWSNIEESLPIYQKLLKTLFDSSTFHVFPVGVSQTFFCRLRLSFLGNSSSLRGVIATPCVWCVLGRDSSVSSYWVDNNKASPRP